MTSLFLAVIYFSMRGLDLQMEYKALRFQLLAVSSQQSAFGLRAYRIYHSP
jgi:hypothetical protein